MSGSRRERIAIQRVYEAPADPDRPCWLVDRIWPRGLSKAQAGLAGWAKEAAPDTGLRRWFGHEPERFGDFRRRYLAQLHAHPEHTDPLLAAARAGPIVLVYAARDAVHNNAVVLRDYLLARLNA